MTKEFHLETQNTEIQPNYREKILSIINDTEERVRVVDLERDQAMSKEVHTKKNIDARKEIIEFEKVRKDVCEAFGVPMDEEHVFIYMPETINGAAVLQRAFRAFYVLIDALKKESFYGEGRIDHNTLLRNLASMASKAEETEIQLADIYNGIDTDPPRYIIFKGFVSKTEEGFRDLSQNSRKVLETPVFDAQGRKIETPSNWFITGHNIKSSSAEPSK
ncbi:MAG: hypothetical protein PHF79_02270 [Candidatus Pacebacteria bacterium]|nr:hypothetical protein [Candidatus Paceibacterota bacterium]